MTVRSELSVEATILGMWAAVAARDWDNIRDFFADDCIFYDVCVGPTIGAKGPDNIIKKLRISLDPLAGYANHPGRMMVDGPDAMYEHSETWTWATGETAVLPFVSIHKVVDGKIKFWKDYWDLSTLSNSAPTDWYESFASGDMSWVSDVTNEV